MLLSAHEVRYFCAWAHGARRSAHGAWPTVGNVGFSTRNQKHFLSTHGSSSLRTNQNWQNITFVSAQKSWLCYLYLRISTVLHLLNFRRDNFSTKIWKFFWGILLAQICPAHGARRTAHENVAFWIIAVRLCSTIQQTPPPKDSHFAHSKNPQWRPLGGEPYVKIPGTGISKFFYCRVWSLFGDNFFL